MTPSPPAATFPGLLSELEACFYNQLAVARREVAEQLNQAARRLREAGDFAQAAAVLVEASAAFSEGAAVFGVAGVAGAAVRGERVRGLEQPKTAGFPELLVVPEEAPALAAAIASGEPVVAMSAPGEISAGLVEFFGHAPEERIGIIPIVAGRTVMGLLYTWGAKELAPLELLAQSAGLALAALAPPKPPSSNLVCIAAPSVGQRLHLKAQRFARVQVAEMRLFHPQAVSAGLARRDLYGALGDVIDHAREAYRRAFLTAAGGMADYLHEELLRTLAHDDPALLGEKYPGPLV
jgi:hypothetical protein